MDDTLEKKFPAEQKITIRNPKDNRAITRPWRSAMHLVDRGWVILGSEANGDGQVKKSSENGGAGTAHNAEIIKNNLEMFTEDELREKYKALYGKKHFHKWTKEDLLKKINDKTEELKKDGQ